MERYLFVPALLRMLAEPAFLAKAIRGVLLAAAGFIVLWALVVWIRALRVTLDLPAASTLGGVLFIVFLTIAIYIVVHILIVRANELGRVPVTASPATSFAVVVIRAIGETYAGLVSMVAIGGTFFVWFTRRPLGAIFQPMPKFFPAYGDSSFMGGITLLALGLGAAALALFVAYVIAELIARSTERYRTTV